MMDYRHLPSLAALRAFSAFAEAGSVVGAARALNVTHPAVSQQLKALEAELGLPLLTREGAGLALTPEGRALAEAVVAGFSGIVRMVGELTGAEAGRPLTITTTPAFASAWLVPRLPDFRRAHPGHDLMIDASDELRRLDPGGIDLAIRFGGGAWPGLQAQLLLDTPVVVVGAPALLQGRAGDSRDAMTQLPWIEEAGSSEAAALLRRLGLARAPQAVLTGLPGNLLVDAARDGQGLLAIARAFVEPDLAAGRLRVLHQDDAQEGYYLLHRPGLQRPAARAFARWALQQAQGAPAVTAAAAAGAAPPAAAPAGPSPDAPTNPDATPAGPPQRSQPRVRLL